MVVTNNVQTQNLCPVCGYEMDDLPRDYNTCPSCGTEFGLHDANASIPQLRAAWIATGPKWWSKTDPQPENWNPFKQLAEVTASPAGSVVVSKTVYTVASTTSTKVLSTSGPWAGGQWVVPQSAQPASSSPTEEFLSRTG